MVRFFADGVAAAHRGTATITAIAEIDAQIALVVSRYLGASDQERVSLALEYMRLKEALEDAKAGRVVAVVTKETS